MKKIKMLAFFVVGIIAGLVVLVGVARFTWHSKFYPGVKIGNLEVAGLTREQARAKIEELASNYQAKLTFNGATWLTPKGAFGTELEATLNEGYHYGRRLSINDYLLLLVNKKTNYPILLSSGKTDSLDNLIDEIATSVEIPPVETNVAIINNKIVLTNGEDGTVVDSELLSKKLVENYQNFKSEPIAIPTKTAKYHLSDDELKTLEKHVAALLKKSLTLSLDDEKIKLGDKELISLLSTSPGTKIANSEAINEYMDGIGKSLNRPPQEARFEFVDNRVKEFAPGKDGVEVKTQMTGEALEMAIGKLVEGEEKVETIEIAAERTSPKITTDKVNQLGINERIGRGESYYAHSIPNRIFNVDLAASRTNSALIAPGEEFSFNKVVGEISGATGYRAAYVISGGRTVLGDGGGVCQVSTTLFRAAMNAGLPIIERSGHAYRVGYYEQNSKPGIDATVFSPSKDFRFLNDTPGHILVQTINDPKTLHLIVEIYGTSDGRVATISEPKLWGITPPLPTIYQDDPTLPAGTTKQVDWAASGAKTSFEYKVTKNGAVIQEKTFSTNYRPWASVYLRGTGI